MRTHSRGPIPLPDAPCGCKTRAGNGSKRYPIMVLPNGDRVCAHGHVWRLTWKKVAK